MNLYTGENFMIKNNYDTVILLQITFTEYKVRYINLCFEKSIENYPKVSFFVILLGGSSSVVSLNILTG